MNNAIFIHADLDDRGLKPSVFRVLCHVARRGNCFSSVPNMAKHCHLHADTVRKALKELVRAGLISVQRRKGTTTIYKVNHDKIIGTPLNNKGSTSYENKGAPPSENQGDKIYPLKSIPVSENGTLTRTIPNWEAVKERAEMIGLPEWRAREWFDSMDGVGWVNGAGNPIMRWESALNSVRTWWQKDGCPKQNENNKRNNSKRVDRNRGTLNERAVGEPNPFAGIENH